MKDKKDIPLRNRKTVHSKAEVETENAVNNVKKLPKKQKKNAISDLEINMQSGPIPRPDILKKYDDLDHGAAKEIIDNGVNESIHRRKMESKSLNYKYKSHSRNDWFGFIIGLFIILIGGILIYSNHAITGTIISGVTAVSLVGEFMSKG